MKKLIIVFSLIAGSVVGQNYRTPNSYTIDKELSKHVFNYINMHRVSESKKPYVWADLYYKSAAAWNQEMVERDIWQHRDRAMSDTVPGTELIVSVNLINNPELNEIDFDMVADSALRQWLSSDWHNGPLMAKRMEYVGESGPIHLAGVDNVNYMLTKYAAISAYVYDYGHYKQVCMVMHLAYYKDKYADSFDF